MKGPSDINPGGAEHTPVSAGFSTLLWALGDDFLGNIVNSGETFFQKEVGDLLLTWEMDCTGTQR